MSFNQIGGDLSGNWVEIVPMLKVYDNQIVYRFYEREKEAVAVIPGIESHWFYAPLWKNRKFLLQAGLSFVTHECICSGYLVICPDCI